jgi:hypothetical protein
MDWKTKRPGLKRPGLFLFRAAERQRRTWKVSVVECETPLLVPVMVIG